MIKEQTTEELILGSFYELLQEKPYEKISIRDITRNCSIANRTFYLHFRDKQELMEWSFLHVLDEYYEKNRFGLTLHQWLRFNAETISGQQFYLRRFAEYRGQNNLLYVLRESLTERYARLLREVYHAEDTKELRDATAFFVGGIVCYIDRMLLLAQMPAPEECVWLFEACMPACIRTCVGG